MRQFRCHACIRHFREPSPNDIPAVIDATLSHVEQVHPQGTNQQPLQGGILFSSRIRLHSPHASQSSLINQAAGPIVPFRNDPHISTYARPLEHDLPGDVRRRPLHRRGHLAQSVTDRMQGGVRSNGAARQLHDRAFVAARRLSLIDRRSRRRPLGPPALFRH